MVMVAVTQKRLILPWGYGKMTSEFSVEFRATYGDFI